MTKGFIILGLMGAGLTGCAYPTSSISQGAEAGHLRFSAPVGATIRIDGQARGAIAADHPVIVDVTPGKHRVEEIMGDRPLFDRNYEIGAGSTVEIGG